MKMACENTLNAGAKGVKILISGRLGGAEIARSECQKRGSIPLQTLDANVDYSTATAVTTYGCIGIKVWIYKGKFGEEIVALPGNKPRRQERGGSPAVVAAVAAEVVPVEVALAVPVVAAEVVAVVRKRLQAVLHRMLRPKAQLKPQDDGSPASETTN